VSPAAAKLGPAANIGTIGGGGSAACEMAFAAYSVVLLAGGWPQSAPVPQIADKTNAVAVKVVAFLAIMFPFVGLVRIRLVSHHLYMKQDTSEKPQPPKMTTLTIG